jgi:hypothetical protein
LTDRMGRGMHLAVEPVEAETVRLKEQPMVSNASER